MSDDDPYWDPEAGVLRNRLGIDDAEELAQFEANLSYARGARLAREPLPGNYDLAHLQAFHRFFFEEIYDWAGNIRTVDISKTTSFCHWRLISSASADVFGRLKGAKFLQGRDRAEFVSSLADFLSDVNALHPFREGNGRTQRAFFGQMGFDAGFLVDWRKMDADQNVLASRRALVGDNEPLRQMLDSLVSELPGDRSALSSGFGEQR